MRSFQVPLRQGRFTPAQQRAFDEAWPRFGIDYSGQPRDLDALFGRNAPKVMEIGTGNGALRFAAGFDPSRDYIGLEVHALGVGRLLNDLTTDNASNAKVYHHDAVEVLNHEIADGALDEVRIYFPDPWHKKRHNKRRLVQPAFAALLVRKLRPGGRLHCATDWEDYASRCGRTRRHAGPEQSRRPARSRATPGLAPADAFRDARAEAGAWCVGFAVREAVIRDW